MMHVVRCAAVALPAISALGSSALAGDDPFADLVVTYAAGSMPGPAPGFTNPQTALGPPERFTGELVAPAAVTAFQGAFGTNEIVSIGGGGQLVLRFDSPVTDDPLNPFGVDLIVFGNSYFIDAAHPAGIVSGINAEGGTIEISPDGVNWTLVPGAQADGLFPTIGYLDAAAYATTPGSVLSDFTRPVNPSLRLTDFMGLDNAQVVALYDGSGGGRGIDIGALGLSAVTHVRIANPPGSGFNIEIDAVADVAPGSSPADLNRDGHVNGLDLAIVLGAWTGAAAYAPCPPHAPADLTGDCRINGLDLAVVLGAWTG